MPGWPGPIESADSSARARTAPARGPLWVNGDGQGQWSERARQTRGAGEATGELALLHNRERPGLPPSAPRSNLAQLDRRSRLVAGLGVLTENRENE